MHNRLWEKYAGFSIQWNLKTKNTENGQNCPLISNFVFSFSLNADLWKYSILNPNALDFNYSKLQNMKLILKRMQCFCYYNFWFMLHNSSMKIWQLLDFPAIPTPIQLTTHVVSIFIADSCSTKQNVIKL